MLIKGFKAPRSVAKGISGYQSKQLVIKAPRGIEIRHRYRPLKGLHHPCQHHSQRQHRCILLLITLILLQQVEVHTCHRLSHRSSYGLSSSDELALVPPASVELQNIDSPMSKRAELTHGSGGGQPEEIFTVDDQIESNYDEYPMIVPKRAALLLDRLMVALHHALEKERSQQSRIGELNESRNNGDEDQKSYDHGPELPEGVPYFDSMYGDDPTVLMDYDFKDLNSINRATGETLMGKSFQRRANIGGAEGVGLVKSGGAMKGGNIALMSGTGGGGGGGNGHSSKGRVYWRCYFNAVSCF